MLYSNCYMLNMFSMGLTFIECDVDGGEETFRSFFFFFRYSIG